MINESIQIEFNYNQNFLVFEYVFFIFIQSFENIYVY